MSVFDPKPMPPVLAGRVKAFSTATLLHNTASMLQTVSPNLEEEVLRNFLAILKKRGLDRVEIEVSKDKFKTASHVAKMYRRQHGVALNLIFKSPDLGGLEESNAMLAEALEPIFQRWWEASEGDPEKFRARYFFLVMGHLYSEDQMSWIFLQLAKYPASIIEDEERKESASKLISEMERSVANPEKSPRDKEKLSVQLYRFDEEVRAISRSIENTEIYLLDDRDDVVRYVDNLRDRDRMSCLSSIAWDYVRRGYIGSGKTEDIGRSLQYSELDPDGRNYRDAMVRLESSVFHKILQPTLLTSPSSSGFVGSASRPALLLGAVLGAAAYKVMRG